MTSLYMIRLRLARVLMALCTKLVSPQPSPYTGAEDYCESVLRPWERASAFQRYLYSGDYEPPKTDPKLAFCTEWQRYDLEGQLKRQVLTRTFAGQL